MCLLGKDEGTGHSPYIRHRKRTKAAMTVMSGREPQEKFDTKTDL
jgi:hypothetical protein